MSGESVERPRRSVPVIAGWTAVAVLAISRSWYSRDLENRSAYWAWVTVAAAVVSVGLAAAVVRAARGDTRAGRASREDTGADRTSRSPVLAVVLWVVLLLAFALTSLGYSESCDGTFAACSYDCINKSGSSWQLLGVLAALAATAALQILRIVSRQGRGRVISHAAPALIVALFVLAVQLVTPHGSQTHCFYAAPHATAGWSHGSV